CDSRVTSGFIVTSGFMGAYSCARWTSRRLEHESGWLATEGLRAAPQAEDIGFDAGGQAIECGAEAGYLARIVAPLDGNRAHMLSAAGVPTAITNGDRRGGAAFGVAGHAFRHRRHSGRL